MALDLGKQIGPMPLGAWIVVVGVGVGIAVWSNNKDSGDPIEVEDTSGTPGVGTGAVGGWTPTTPPPTDTTPKDPTNNEEWGRQCINWLIAQGYDATVSDSAIRKYLSGESTSIQEYTLIRIALTRFGSPPQPLPPNPNPPPTIPTPPTTPSRPPIIKPPTQAPFPVRPAPKPPAPKPPPRVSVRYYTVKRGDNLWNIATRYYGSGFKYGTIYNANRYGKRRADGSNGMIKNPALIYPEWRLIIP